MTKIIDYLKKYYIELIIAFFSVLAILVFFILVLDIDLDYIDYSYNTNDTSLAITIWWKTFLFRLSVYIVPAIIIYFSRKSKYVGINGIKNKDYLRISFDILFKFIASFSVLFVVLSLDIRFGLTVFNASNAFISLVGILLISKDNKSLSFDNLNSLST